MGTVKNYYLVIALALLALSLPLNESLYKQKTGRTLAAEVKRSGGDPTEFLGVTMLGGFRGLATDLLWIRAINLSARGEYAEMLALTEVITRLQPHQTSVPMFQSWTLAYNISSLEASPERRWLWIKSALDLLKQSLQKNPDSYDLHFQLAFIYFHRVNWEKHFRDRVFGEEGKTGYELAIEWLERSLKTPRARPQSAALEAGILLKLGRIQEAKELVKRSAIRFPDSPQLKLWSERLAKDSPDKGIKN